MKIAVRYYSKGGNTQKLAEALAKAVGVKAEFTASPLKEKADLLFLGSSVYAGKPDAEVVEFLKANAKQIGKIVCFGSSASGRTTRDKLTTVADEVGVPVAEACFSCPGKFLWMHKGRPNEQDLAAIAEFGKQQL